MLRFPGIGSATHVMTEMDFLRPKRLESRKVATWVAQIRNMGRAESQHDWSKLKHEPRIIKTFEKPR